jgi:16S rRNA (guanine966-N2)-methyltransferase
VVAALGSLEGTQVLDLYAGSGAVGLEALSRGAADTILVESDPRAAQVIRRNIEVLGLPGATVVQDKVGRVLGRGPAPSRPRDFVFADPPYATGDDELGQVLVTLAEAGWLATGALVVVERDARSGRPPWPASYVQDRSRKYGETVLWYGRASGAAPAAAD